MRSGIASVLEAMTLATLGLVVAMEPVLAQGLFESLRSTADLAKS
jgi:hypothetical protein